MPGAIAAKAATRTIPIIFLTAADPVEIGLVKSLGRPGGNVTGVTVELGAKQLELIYELVPRATVIGFLVNPNNPTVAETQSKQLDAACRALGLKLEIVNAGTENDFDAVFSSLVKMRAGALVIAGETLFTSGSGRLAELALRYAVPAIYQFREFAVAGGLMSYGANLSEAHRLTGVYAGRILQGIKPADLPVERVSKFELTINLKTARALGLTIPQSLLLRTNEVIQ